MRFVHPRRLALFGAVLFLGIFLRTVAAQTIPGMLETNSIKFHEDLCARFKAADTNVPLLVLDSFEGPLKNGSVSREGKLRSGWYNGISNPAHWDTLTTNRLALLVQAMDALPTSCTNSLPLKRQAHVSGIRSNGCFHFVYDLGDCPKEVKNLFDLFGWPFADQTWHR
jgi:hypothetical protein